jgi:hypothetical protein
VSNDQNPLIPAGYDIVWSAIAVVLLALMILALVSLARSAKRLSGVQGLLWTLVVIAVPPSVPWRGYRSAAAPTQRVRTADYTHAEGPARVRIKFISRCNNRSHGDRVADVRLHGWRVGPRLRPQQLRDPGPARLEQATTPPTAGRTRPYRVDAPWAGSTKESQASAPHLKFAG